MRDVWTVVWREWREHALLDGGWVALSSLGVFVGLVGVLLPWQVGEPWIRAPWMLVFWAWMPLFLVTILAADSVAGERERHTLETLLATRLPTGALLAGKLISVVGWVWGALLACLPVGLLMVNLTRSGPLVLYEPATALAVLGLSLLAAVLGAVMAVLVSIRVPTVRQAQQILAVCVLALFLLPVLGLRLLPEEVLGRMMASLLPGGSPVPLALTLMGLFLTADVALLALAHARFRRMRLMGE